MRRRETARSPGRHVARTRRAGAARRPRSPPARSPPRAAARCRTGALQRCAAGTRRRPPAAQCSPARARTSASPNAQARCASSASATSNAAAGNDSPAPRQRRGRSRIIRLRSRYPRATLNPQLARLQPYPFERLRALFAGGHAEPGANRRSISRSASLNIRRRRCSSKRWPTAPGASRIIPQRPAPPRLREAIAAWLKRRHGLQRARCADPGAAGARQPRSAVRVRADRHRPEPRRRDRGRAQSVLPDLRRRGAARRGNAVLRQQPRRQRLRAAMAPTCPNRSGRAPSSSTSARPTTRPDG